jgi:hypothetical protein
MRYREGYGTLISSIGKNNFSNDNNSTKIGKVFGVVTTENTPTKKQFQRAGGFLAIGSVFYLNYKGSENINGNNLDSFFDSCNIAKPFDTSNQNYPLVGELVLLETLPSAGSQLSPNSNQTYYIGTINLFNNQQQNSLTDNPLGKTFTEKADIRSLLAFEGDRIYQGRKGNGIRFGSTVKYHADLNEWSSTGNDGDPITIMVNGYVTTDTGSLSPNIEEINKEQSSIYLTSTQLLPLTPDRNDTLNSLTKPLTPNKYLFPQVIINSDRITLNSKKDEVMIFAKTNVEINTNNIINLNAGNRVHLNTKYIYLGTKSDGTAPSEPLLLGNKTVKLLNDLMKVLSELGNTLTSVVSTPEGSPLIGVNTAGTTLQKKVVKLQKQLSKIKSTSNYTI